MTKLGYNIEQARIGEMIREIEKNLIINGQERRTMEERLELLKLLKNEILRKELIKNGLSEEEIEKIICQ